MNSRVVNLSLPDAAELEATEYPEQEEDPPDFCYTTQFLLALESAINITVTDAQRSVEESEPVDRVPA